MGTIEQLKHSSRPLHWRALKFERRKLKLAVAVRSETTFKIQIRRPVNVLNFKQDKMRRQMMLLISKFWFMLLVNHAVTVAYLFGRSSLHTRLFMSFLNFVRHLNTPMKHYADSWMYYLATATVVKIIHIVCHKRMNETILLLLLLPPPPPPPPPPVIIIIILIIRHERPISGSSFFREYYWHGKI